MSSPDRIAKHAIKRAANAGEPHAAGGGAGKSPAKRA